MSYFVSEYRYPIIDGTAQLVSALSESFNYSSFKNFSDSLSESTVKTCKLSVVEIDGKIGYRTDIKEKNYFFEVELDYEKATILMTGDNPFLKELSIFWIERIKDEQKRKISI